MIGVVGGGIAGLAAAYRLREAGHEVQVFEASDDVGGLAATYPTNGDRIEKFYHHLSKSEETIVDLARDLGLGDRVEWRVGENAYYVDGVVHPLDTPWEIAAYPHLSVYDKFRLGMLTLEVDVRGGVPSFDTYDDLEDFEHVPIKDFLLEHTTRSVYEYFFEPLLDAKFGDRKEDVSAAWLLGRIKFRGERDLLRGEILGYFQGGFGVLLDALLDAVGRENVTTNARVQEIAFDDEVGSLTVETGGAPASGSARSAERRSADSSSGLRGGETASNGTSAERSQRTSKTSASPETRSVSEDSASSRIGEASETTASPSPGSRDDGERERDDGEWERDATDGGGSDGRREAPPDERVARDAEHPPEGASEPSEPRAPDGETIYEVEDVVVTTMPHLLERWTGYECDVDFQAAVCAVVGMTEPLTDTYWLNIADDAPFGALIEHTNFVPPERYGGEHLLYVASYVQDLHDELWQLDDQGIRDRWMDGIRDLFPEFSHEQVTWMEVARAPRAAPIYERGYLDTVVPYDLGEDVAEGLYYAGMASRAQYPERSLNGGVVAGYECADRIIEKRR